MVKELKSLQQNFLWKGREHCKPHLIKWDDLSRFKKGELLLGGIANRNLDLLDKWYWWFSKEQYSLRASIICSKYKPS